MKNRFDRSDVGTMTMIQMDVDQYIRLIFWMATFIGFVFGWWLNDVASSIDKALKQRIKRKSSKGRKG